MNIYLSNLIFLFIVCMGALFSPAHSTDLRSAEALIRSFYSWYVPKAIAARDEPAWAKVLRSRPDVLSKKLKLELMIDVNKKVHASGMIEGLDFDPFLGSQDPCPRFKIKKTRMERAHYLVTIKPICPSGSPQLAITVYIIQEKQRLVIDDVIYNDGHTLRHALEAH